MDCAKERQDAEDGVGREEDLFFIEDSGGSEDEVEIMFSHQKQAARLSRESSPPLLLFNITSGRRDTNRSPASSVDLQEEQEEDSDQGIEEWMILGGEEELGDSNIQLNLSYWSSSEDDSGDEGETVPDTVLLFVVLFK